MKRESSRDGESFSEPSALTRSIDAPSRQALAEDAHHVGFREPFAAGRVPDYVVIEHGEHRSFGGGEFLCDSDPNPTVQALRRRSSEDDRSAECVALITRAASRTAATDEPLSSAPGATPSAVGAFAVAIVVVARHNVDAAGLGAL